MAIKPKPVEGYKDQGKNRKPFRERFSVSKRDMELLKRIATLWRQNSLTGALRIVLEEEHKRSTGPKPEGVYRNTIISVAKGVEIGQRVSFQTWLRADDWARHTAIQKVWQFSSASAAVRFAIRIQSVIDGVATIEEAAQL